MVNLLAKMTLIYYEMIIPWVAYAMAGVVLIGIVLLVAWKRKQ